MTHLRPVVKALIRRPLYTTAIALVTAVGFALLANLSSGMAGTGPPT